MSYKPCGCKGKCRCGRSPEVVYPVREEVKKTHSKERVKHIHPSHTRVINHHTIKNEHYYPHSTSYEERVNEVDVRGESDGFGRGDVRGISDECGRGYVRGAHHHGHWGGGGHCGCGCQRKCCCRGGRRRRGWI